MTAHKKHAEILAWCAVSLLFSTTNTVGISSCKDPHRKHATFSTLTNHLGIAVCATGTSSEVQKTRSKILCVSRCQQSSECLGVNWKTSRSCELFNFQPTGYKSEKGCSYLVPEFGSLRLVDGDDNSGRLEVNINSSWTTAWQTDWTTRNTIVACRQLGFYEGQQTSDQFNGNSGQAVRVGLNNVACVGNEAKLTDCKRSPDFQNDCNHGNDVFLLCYDDGDLFAGNACNGGYRMDDQYGYQCMNCTPGFTGSNCQQSYTGPAAPSKDCFFPFTWMNNLHYRCFEGRCPISHGVWMTCLGPPGYSVLNLTINLTIPTFSVPTPVISVNNWIVFQQRIDPSTSFNLGMSSYTTGFGLYNGNYWMGLEKVYQMIKGGSCRGRIEVLNDLSQWMSFEYDIFYLNGASSFYKIHISRYYGDKSVDPMNHPPWVHNGQMFSAPGSDHDACGGWDCAAGAFSGWWFPCCGYINLNGPFNGGNFAYPDDVQTTVLHYLQVSRMMFKC